MAARFELHALQQLACATLMLEALGRKPAQILRVAGQPVAQALQLRQRQQAWTADEIAPDLIEHVSRRGDVRERIGDDRRAFALEPSDLPSQGPANLTLGGLHLRFGLTTIRHGGDVPFEL
jgi:hypothetical protein